jgi:hypothetical protein
MLITHVLCHLIREKNGLSQSAERHGSIRYDETGSPEGTIAQHSFPIPHFPIP